jgi:long-chain fatty acid transport protein
VKRSPATYAALAVSVGGAFAITLLACEENANAAGMYFSDRGVRPMGRAGAFVAGADDLGSIWYNPAGLADTKTSFLLDFGWLSFSAQYTRALYVLDADNIARVVTSPTVKGSSLESRRSSASFRQRLRSR